MDDIPQLSLSYRLIICLSPAALIFQDYVEYRLDVIVAPVAQLLRIGTWMQEVRGSNPRWGGLRVSRFQASGGIEHPAIKSLHSAEHHAGHSIRTKKTPPSQSNMITKGRCYVGRHQSREHHSLVFFGTVRQILVGFPLGHTA